MIQKDQIIPMLLEACPGFRPAWEAHLAYWGNDSRGIYIDISEFVSYLLRTYEDGDIHGLECAFDLLERFLVDGDPDTKECAFVGFIGKLRRRASWKPYNGAAFIPFLKPHSRKAWFENEQLWAGKSSLMDVIRSDEDRSGEPQR